MISEKVELLGKGLYGDEIPDELTIKSIPTSAELDMVGSEDFVETMLDKIFPKAIEEKINFRHLLEIDFHWLCRCLRIINYGPYFTTNTIFCPDCDSISRGDYQVNLNGVECVPLPEGFVNNIKISKDEFIDYDGDMILRLPTIAEVVDASKDKLFASVKNTDYARLCYTIKSIKGKNVTPVEVKSILETDVSGADFLILKEIAKQLTDYGLRAGGSTVCPKCKSRNASFIALVDDRFLRPSLGDLRAWKHDKNSRK